MTDVTPGEVVEIEIGPHKAYAQVTHNHSSYPPVVRALDGLHDNRPSDLNAVVAGKTRFVAMIPLLTALTRVGATFECLGTFDVPSEHGEFPTFRMPIRDKKGEIVYWWFWDGRSLSYDVELTSDQDALPMREVMTGSRFLQLIST
ncbi:hypothetical protein [Roseivivax sp. THAF30]|uniref:hypothetical protein n=1 Tax=Roseivivax sp. THAF30 TaxID=2587852 RepID=UPI001268B0F2|nr:hypothetical protein [Roseivivax sp. THAF30]QFT62005.1 hypothetical protein FIU91_03605 [Roseivivax sp. THAF30]